MIFSAVIVALNRLLLGETHRHADAGYKLIAELRMEKGLRCMDQDRPTNSNSGYEISHRMSHLLPEERKVGQDRLHLRPG
jgi:hypothetical protein